MPISFLNVTKDKITFRIAMVDGDVIPPPGCSAKRLKLEELKSMYDKGLITKSDYDQKKKQILDQM